VNAPVQAEAGWPALFQSAFRQSRNPMTLVDEERRTVDVNGAYLGLLGYRREDLIGRRLVDLVVTGPRMTDAEWHDAITATPHATGEAELRRADGTLVGVQFAATVEVATGRRLVLFVVQSVSRWGPHFRREPEPEPAPERPLTPRERDIVWLVALGMSGPEIADELHIAHDTVRTHVRNAMGKAGARSRAHLVAKAIGEGLVTA
jgi:PAS domain S-box-containing protein